MNLRDRQSCLQGAYEDVRLTTRRPWAMEETSADRLVPLLQSVRTAIAAKLPVLTVGEEQSRAGPTMLLFLPIFHLGRRQSVKCQVCDS